VACSSRGISWAEATLNSENIKLAIVKLSWSEGINISMIMQVKSWPQAGRQAD